MARYIDADALYVNIKAECNPYGKPTISFDDGCKVLDMIRRTPTADVAPVVHAHWIVDVRGSYGVRNCSNCGGYGNDTHTHYGRTHGDVDGFRIEPLPYCPHCGAKMDGVIYND